MAVYKYAYYLGQSQETYYDHVHSPGTQSPLSGIYRCEGCGREVVSEHPKLLPPQSHHQHTVDQGNIRWRLIVYADHRPKSAVAGG